MLVIYTSPSCSSCRKAKLWLKEHNIKFREKDIINHKLTKEDIYLMLRNSENGFEDIISTRSKAFEANNQLFEDMKFQELTKFIIDNPTVLRRPIMVDDRAMQVGYNDEEIRVFIPRKYREMFKCENCEKEKPCQYHKTIDEQVKMLHSEA